MKRILFSILFLTISLSTVTFADTIGRYAGIAKSIPEASLKADPKSQAWAHSARTILNVAEESIAESIAAVQTAANQLNRPIFCLPKDQSINTELIHQILEQKVSQLKEADATKNLSDVVVASLTEKYPCQSINQAQAGPESLFAPREYTMVHVDTNSK